MHQAPSIAIVTRETRMQGLLKRRSTRGAADFMLSSKAKVGKEVRARRSEQRLWCLDAGVDIEIHELASLEAYEEEDTIYERNLSILRQELHLVDHPLVWVDRELLPTFDFGRCFAVVVVGQDGLVANTAKYAGDIPIIGVNPDPDDYEGILLPFIANEVQFVIARINQRRAKIKPVTLAEAELIDGQKLLAFNDFFIGNKTHQSARYIIQASGQAEPQISSGMIVSTGAGSTGWLSSVYNMTCGIAQQRGVHVDRPAPMTWEEPRLRWAVREPYRSKQSQADMVAGVIESNDEVIIESLMPNSGVIFSDGIEGDFLQFNSGTIAHISVSKQQAKLVVR